MQGGIKPPECCDPTQFRDVIGRFATGVTVITAHHEGIDYGMTASAVCSLALEPPMLLACVNRAVPTNEGIIQSGVFGVSILQGSQGDVARHFATPQTDKFSGIEISRGRLGVPLLNNALAWLECRVVTTTPGGTHNVFLGEVVHVQAGVGRPLVYFRGGFGQLESPVVDLVDLYASWA